MGKQIYLFLLAYVCSSNLAMGQAGNLADINIGDVGYHFLCEGGEGASRITVKKTAHGNTEKSIVFEKIWSRRMTAAWEL